MLRVPRKITQVSEAQFPGRPFSEILEARNLLNAFLSDFEHKKSFEGSLKSMLMMLYWMLGDDEPCRPLLNLLEKLRRIKRVETASNN